MQIIELNIPLTFETPGITLRSGEIIIKGRSMKIIDTAYFNKIEEWINKYVSEPAHITTIDVNFEYLNTGNLAYYNNLLRKLVSINSSEKKILINWHAEEGDDDMIEKGEYLSEMLNIPFNFVIISDQL